jgi:hypothetical protein
MIPIISPRKATPPTVPPAIAPILLDEDEFASKEADELEPDRLSGAGEMVMVAKTLGELERVDDESETVIGVVIDEFLENVLESRKVIGFRRTPDPLST